MDTWMLSSFVIFLVAVGVITYQKTRKTNLNTSDGFFLGGRSLTAKVIAGSLLMTNISAANFVGMSAQAYTANMSVMGWEVVSGVTLVLVAIFLMPHYLKQGVTTIPEFVGNRYDESTKRFLAIFFLIGLVVNGYPITLYAGTLAMHQLFDIEATLGISYAQGIWILSWLIGLISMLYAITGGLRAVAISDSINGIVLIVGGLMVPVFALIYLGSGNLADGYQAFLHATPEKFNSIGAPSDPLPFSTLFTGLLLVNLYYWGTDQGIIQRGLGAKNLKEGQAGIIYAGFLKVLTPFIVIVPGIMAFHIFGGDIGNADTIYPRLVNTVLPKPLVGFFAAAMFGAIMSTLNSILNSASTIFALDIYKPIWGKQASEKRIVGVGKVFGVAVAIISMFVAPLLMYTSSGLFDYLQRISGFFNVPIFTIIFIGYVAKRVPPIAAKVAIIFFVVVYGITQLGIWNTGLHFLHISAILFVLSSIIMLIIGKIKPMERAFVMPNARVVEVKPWRNRFKAGGGVIYTMLAAYILFSPIGLAQAGGANAMTVLWLALAAALVIIVVMVIEHWVAKQPKAEEELPLNMRVEKGGF